MRHTLAAASAAFALLLAASDARAAPITYTETATASGSLGTASFTDAAVTLSFTGDTAAIVAPAPGLAVNPAGTVTVVVAGAGTGTFNAGGQAAIAFQGLGGAAIGANSRDPSVDQAGQTYILGTAAPIFTTYGLAAPIGPEVGTAVFRPGLAFSTTAGDFLLTSVGEVTFTATAGATTVSEPASLALLGLGLVGFGLARRR